jgi:hypothetical protein
MKLKIHINIDELVLEGLSHKDYPEIIMTAKLELARLIMEEYLDQSISNNVNEAFRTNSKTQYIIHVNSKNVHAIGMQIASSVHQSLRKRSLFHI